MISRSPLIHSLPVRSFAVLAVCLLFGRATPAEAGRPNVVLIMADDMGYECVGANGSTTYETPHLDRLAKQGLRFEHCHSQPICTPSRVQIMTGLYNQRNYVRFGLLHEKQTTFAQLLKGSGYDTCIVGKWQLKGGFEGPGHFGFDEYCLWQLTRRPNRYPNPGLEINGKEVDFKEGQYGPDIVNEYARDFIARHAESDKPFLLYYPMMLPHWPFEPTPDSEEWDPTFRRDDKTEKGYKLRKQKFFVDMVAYTDKMVGQLVTQLDESGLRENTLVLFTGDNGTFTSIVSKMNDGRSIKGGKGSTKDNGTHVPFIASWPGHITPGKTSQALVDFSDFLPTLCDVAEVEVPSNLKPDGRSFLPVLLGRQPSHRDWIYCWYARNGGKTGSEHARDRRFKLYRNGRLYDVVADPDEQHDLRESGKPLSEAAAAAGKTLGKVLDDKQGTRVMLQTPKRTAKPKG